MKKIKLLTYLMLGIFALSSCDKDETKIFLNDNVAAPAITSPTTGTTKVMTAADLTKNFIFTWTAAFWGPQVAISYQLQFDLKGNGFKNAKSFTVTQIADTVSGEALNNMLLSFQTDPESQIVAQTFDVRVVATINPDVDAATSPVINLTYTPYYVPIVYPAIYVPGGYQAASGYTADWSPDKAPKLSSKNSDNKYEGYVYFAAPANFKFTSAPDWSHINWGSGGPGLISPTGGDIPMAAAGYYKINVNTTLLTWSYMKTDWGVIGSATAGGWNSDQNMTYNPTTKVWTWTGALVVGDIKFRANDDWALSYGSATRDGKLDTADNNNIPIAAAGNYTLTIDLSNAPRYTYKIVKN